MLLPYQARWCLDDSKVQVCVKSRRIGITWASALRAVMEGMHSGGWDTYYTGYNHDLAREFISEAGAYARTINETLASKDEFIFKDIDENGEPREILAYRITFASGYRIIALSSYPRNLRGIKGRIVIDEAGFHDNLAELLKAAMACLIWGGAVSIISTLNGADNPFTVLCDDIRAGRLDYSLHQTTLDDALEEGLYERIASIVGLEQSEEAKVKWRKELIEAYGDGADEELFCIPRKGGGVYLGRQMVESCMSEDCKVLRLKLEDDFTFKPKEERTEALALWAKTVLSPALANLDQGRATFVGEDFGRKSDLTAIAIGQETQTLGLKIPILVELRNVPYKQQEELMDFILTNVPRLGRAAVDSTGNGSSLGEHLAQQYGEVLINRVGVAGNAWLGWYAENLPKFKARFEDGKITIPQDLDVRQDLTAFQVIDGVPKLPKVRVQSKSPDADKGDYRHGDAGVALALCEYASRQGAYIFKPSKPGLRRGGMFGHKGAW